MPYEFLMLVKETNFGATKSTPTPGTDSIYVRLAGANRFTMRPMKRQLAIGRSGGWAGRSFTVGDRWSYAGRLQAELCYTQADLLLGWAVTRIDSGRTVPWASSGTTVGNLASMTAYHGVTRSDGTVKRVKYLGAMVSRWSLATTEADGIAMLSLDLIAQKHAGNATDSSSDPDATEFPAPADTDFPTDVALFTHLGGDGGLTIGGSELSCAYGLTITAENSIDARFCAGSAPEFLGFAELRGRKVNVNASVRFTASPNWRNEFDTQTVKTVEVVYDNGVNTITFDLFDQNIITGIDDDLQPGKTYEQALALENQWDNSDGNDITVAVA